MSKLVKENAEYLAQETTDKLNTLYTVRMSSNIISKLLSDTDIIEFCSKQMTQNDIIILQLGKEGE